MRTVNVVDCELRDVLQREEWLYVVSGTPILRDPGGERTLDPGSLVAFPSGPLGGHAVRGPGRIVIFSAGARGFGEAFVTVYPD